MIQIQGKYQGDFVNIKATPKLQSVFEDVSFFLKHCSRFNVDPNDYSVYLEREDDNENDTFQVSFYCDTMNDLLIRVFLSREESLEIHKTIFLFDNRDESEYLLITR